MPCTETWTNHMLLLVRLFPLWILFRVHCACSTAADQCGCCFVTGVAPPSDTPVAATAPSLAEDTKPVIAQVHTDVSGSCSSLIHRSSPASKPMGQQTFQDGQQPYARSQGMPMPEDIKPVHLQSENSLYSGASHLKAPSMRALPLDMRYSPYSRPGYPLNTVPPTYLPHAPHSHVYPPLSVTSAGYPSCQGSQAYPSYSVAQQGYGYPAIASSGNPGGALPGNGTTTSELQSLDMASTSGAERPSVMIPRTH